MTGKTIWTVGYGIIEGTWQEKKAKFQERLRYLQQGIGKPITVVDIRKERSGSRNGKWFRQFPTGLFQLVADIRDRNIYCVSEPALANGWGGSKWELEELYASELAGSVLAKNDMGVARGRVKAIAEAGERAVALLCGCRDAYKPNGTTPNCHRVPLAEALVRELGDGWSIIHL